MPPLSTVLFSISVPLYNLALILISKIQCRSCSQWCQFSQKNRKSENMEIRLNFFRKFPEIEKYEILSEISRNTFILTDIVFIEIEKYKNNCPKFPELNLYWQTSYLQIIQQFKLEISKNVGQAHDWSDVSWVRYERLGVVIWIAYFFRKFVQNPLASLSSGLWSYM